MEQVETAATVDWGEPFVKTCYYLEGDGPLALDCYEVIDQVIIASVATENMAEMLTKQPHSHPLHEQWVTYARSCVKDGIDYQLTSSLRVSLAVF